MPTGRRKHARSRHALLFAAMTASGAVAATDARPFPADFLEYLGSWEADEADWVVANAAATASAPAASRTVSQQPNPTTTDTRGAVQSPATTEHKP
jgi:hypothetical protein